MDNHDSGSAVFLDEQFHSIKEFLGLLHPFLLVENRSEQNQLPSDICIEIRPISRGEYDYSLSRSLNLWNLNDTSLLRLYQFLHRHQNQPYCLYYSVYAFDYEKIAKTKEGKPAVKGKITSDNALFTQEVVLDFDNITEFEQKQLDLSLQARNLEGLWTFTGHGFQLHILLQEPIFDPFLLKEMVELFHSHGFPCDTSCIDPARVMRLPYTFNYKCFNDEQYEDEKDSPPFSRIVKETKKRYSIEEVKEALGLKKEGLSLPMKWQEENKEASSSPQKRKEAIKSVSPKEDSIALHKITYPFIDKYSIPEPINKMLNNTPQGFRNKVLGFLIYYLKRYLRLGKHQLEEILSLWAVNACHPAYPSGKFTDDFSRLYYINGLLYDANLTKKFGFIDFGDQIQIQKQDIYITNAFLKQLSVLDGNEVRAYLGIKLMEHLEKEITIDSLAQLLQLTSRALRPVLKQLISKNHIYVVKGNRRMKEPNRYFSTKITSYSDGYLKLSFNDVKAYLDDLGIGELKLYLFMSYKFFFGDCFMSQKNIGSYIGVTQHAVSTITKSLEEKMYIRITKTPLFATKTDQFIYSCTYTLLR